MPIVKVSRYVRADAKANPNVLFVFGDNVERVGYGGQAGAMRGEPNAVGIATKWTPGMSPGDFFDDAELEDASRVISQDIAPLRAYLACGGVVVMPADGLGTGLSELPTRAPKVYAYLQQQLKELEGL